MPAKIYACQSCGEHFVVLTLRECPACGAPVPDSVRPSGARVIDFMQRAQLAARTTRASQGARDRRETGREQPAKLTSATAAFGAAPPEGPGLGPRLLAVVPGLLSSFGIIQLPAFAGLDAAWRVAAIAFAPWLFAALIELSLQSRERVLTARERIVTYWLATLWYTICLVVLQDLFLGLTGLLLIPLAAPRIAQALRLPRRRRRASSRSKS